MSKMLNTNHIQWRKAVRLDKKPKLKRILNLIEVNFSDVLLSIPFKCAFSLPLFLILKFNIFYMYWYENDEDKYKLALPCEINVNLLKNETNICKNSLKKALKELLDVGLIEKIDWMKPYHSACYMVLIKNVLVQRKMDTRVDLVLYNYTAFL